MCCFWSFQLSWFSDELFSGLTVSRPGSCNTKTINNPVRTSQQLSPPVHPQTTIISDYRDGLCIGSSSGSILLTCIGEPDYCYKETWKLQLHLKNKYKHTTWNVHIYVYIYDPTISSHIQSSNHSNEPKDLICLQQVHRKKTNDPIRPRDQSSRPPVKRCVELPT